MQDEVDDAGVSAGALAVVAPSEGDSDDDAADILDEPDQDPGEYFDGYSDKGTDKGFLDGSSSKKSAMNAGELARVAIRQGARVAPRPRSLY